MLRNLFLLVASVIGLALVRNLIKQITRVITQKAAGAGADRGNQPGGTSSSKKAHGGRLERDPQTGTYVDPSGAVTAKVGGTTFFFESESSRDAYLADRKRRA